MNRIIGIIPARGGSKGIPEKNIRDLAGKPLIAWTIEAALKSNVCSRIIVSTDNQKIMDVARHWGAEVPFIRPDHLSTDTSTSVSVIQHAIDFLFSEGIQESDYILLLQPTSPLREDTDIKNVVDIARSKHAEAVVSVTESHFHPQKALIITHQGNLQRYFTNKYDNVRRQDIPPAYAENGAVYLNRISTFLKEKTFLPQNKTTPYIMPPERSMDIDTLWDLRLAELIINMKSDKNHE